MSQPRTTILLVDDDRGVRDALSRALEREGYRVEPVASIAGAIDVVRSSASRYAAAVVDLKLADGLALSVLRELRLPPYPVATVVLSGVDATEAAQIALSEGAYKLLRKPCGPDVVTSAVAGAVARTREYRRWLEGDDEPIEVSFRVGRVDVPLDQQGFVRAMSELVSEVGELSGAEARLVEYLLLGYEYGEIARQINVSVETVRSHVRAIKSKLDLDSTRSLWRVCLAELERRAHPQHFGTPS